MSNGNPNLDDYFPGGSTATNTIKTRISNQIQSGVLTINGPVLTLDDYKTIRNEDRKEDRKKFWISNAVTIVVAIIIFILTWYYL